MKTLKVENNTLYTPVIDYIRGRPGKGDSRIRVIGTIHIGPAQYYRFIQSQIDGIPQGYHEGMNPVKDWSTIPLYKRPFTKLVGSELDKLIKRVADNFGFVTEGETLAVAGSWRNVDVGLDELLKDYPLKDLMITYLGSKMLRIYETSTRPWPGIYREFLRECLWSEFFEGEEQASSPGEEKVLLKDRNQRLFDDMKPGLDKGIHDELGIVYGVNHLPGIDVFLFDEGFRKTKYGQLWVPAWDNFEPPERVKTIINK